MATGKTGSYSLEDLLSNRFQSAAEFGLETIAKTFNEDLAYVNATLTEHLAELAETSADKQRIYGSSALLAPTEVDEFGEAPTQKILTGTTVAFPMRMYKTAVGFTTKYLEIESPAKVAEKYIQVRQGHAVRVGLEIAKALYNNTNYTFQDFLGEQAIDLGVKRLINADGSVIADSPAGVTFDGATHTHYIARAAALNATDVDALVATVTEHGHTKDLKIVIALADKAAMQALTTGFIALGDGGIVYNATDVTAIKSDMSDLENQLIGYWRNTSVQIWVKPWGIASYWLCYSGGSPEKLLVRRQRAQTNLQGLRMIQRIPGYPLVSDNFESEYGFGVWNRTAGAILYTGATSWANPSL